jgi:hypothetical protein
MMKLGERFIWGWIVTLGVWGLLIELAWDDMVKWEFCLLVGVHS